SRTYLLLSTALVFAVTTPVSIPYPQCIDSCLQTRALQNPDTPWDSVDRPRQLDCCLFQPHRPLDPRANCSGCRRSHTSARRRRRAASGQRPSRQPDFSEYPAPCRFSNYLPPTSSCHTQGGIVVVMSKPHESEARSSMH